MPFSVYPESPLKPMIFKRWLKVAVQGHHPVLSALLYAVISGPMEFLQGHCVLILTHCWQLVCGLFFFSDCPKNQRPRTPGSWRLRKEILIWTCYGMVIQTEPSLESAINQAHLWSNFQFSSIWKPGCFSTRILVCTRSRFFWSKSPPVIPTSHTMVSIMAQSQSTSWRSSRGKPRWTNH